MKTYLFDFDGTLVDSMPTFVDNMLSVLDDFQISYTPDIIKIITPLGYQGTARYFVKLGVPLTEEEIMQRLSDNAREAYSLRIEAKEHVKEVLMALKERGDDLNVLTASPHSMLDPCLKRLGLYDLFTYVWSCDDFKTTKADPQIYHRAAEKMGQPVEKVLFLDDNFNADQVAKSAGMKVCGVYDDSSAEYEESIRATADFYICDFSQLPQIDWE